jgi:hypothetical protein
MALAKLEMTPLDRDGLKFEAKRLKVLFNPSSYSISSAIEWNSQKSRELNAPLLTYGGGSGRTLSLDLFYDVTEPIEGVVIEDVRSQTNKLVSLSRKDRDLGRPPVVAVEWGAAPPAGSDFPFVGVISSLAQNFTLFRSNGAPLRADVKVSFMEFADPEIDKRKLDPEFTTRVVKRGDTLSGLAAEVYGDPALWRVIARANRVEDALKLEPGARLSIPKIR